MVVSRISSFCVISSVNRSSLSFYVASCWQLFPPRKPHQVSEYTWYNSRCCDFVHHVCCFWSVWHGRILCFLKMIVELIILGLPLVALAFLIPPPIRSLICHSTEDKYVAFTYFLLPIQTSSQAVSYLKFKEKNQRSQIYAFKISEL
jgi:hypothetical protein